MKKDAEQIKYPIGKQSTTVKSVFTTLKVLDSAGVKSAVGRGQITVNGAAVVKPFQRVSPGDTIRYADMEILVYIDEEAKRQRLTQSIMTSGANYGSTLGKAGGGFGQRVK